MFLCGRRREECFGVGGEVVAAIRTIEAFGEYDDVCAFFCGGEDFTARIFQILRFVDA